MATTIYFTITGGRLGHRPDGAGAADAEFAAQGPLLALTRVAVREQLKLNGNEFGWEAMDQLTRITLGLQVWSPAQQYQTLVDFLPTTPTSSTVPAICGHAARLRPRRPRAPPGRSRPCPG